MSIIRSAVDAVMPPSGKTLLMRQSPDDVVITWCKRSATGKAKKGQFKDMQTDELLISFFKVSLD